MTTASPSLDLFKGRHFDQEIIVLCARWYLSFKLSSRDLVRMMAERGVVLAHTTILRWVQRYVPEFEKRWSRYPRYIDGSWRCDETYIKVRGRWTYLYRAVDKHGRTVDFSLSERRDVAACPSPIFIDGKDCYCRTQIRKCSGPAASEKLRQTWAALARVNIKRHAVT